MDNFSANSAQKLFSLSETSEKLNVTIETLIKWNELNILKPTITLEGTIGYTQDQISHFLEIRHVAYSQQQSSTQNNTLPTSAPSAPTQVHQKMPVVVDMFDGNDNKKEFFSYINAPLLYSRISNSPLLSAGISFAIIISILGFAFVSRDTTSANIGSSINHNSSSILSSQTSNVKVPKVTAIPTPGALDDRQSKQENLASQGENVLKEKINAKGSIFARNDMSSVDANTLATQQAKPALSTAMATTDELPSRGTFDNDPIFDNTGKIKGEAVDTLSTTLGGIGVIANSIPSQMNNSPLNTISLVTLGILSMLFIFPKSLSYAGRGGKVVRHQVEPEISIIPSKIIEVDQKADGTIVLYFQGKEYKISKPELYSESDQFIERLMDLVKPGMKEIEYVLTGDSVMESKTPLSRLVTRLGFVGIKRDLFFPRTAKDRVYFRKYLTSKDLKDMNLTTDDVLLGLQMPI